MRHFLKQVFWVVWRDKACRRATLLCSVVLASFIAVESTLPIYFKFFLDRCADLDNHASSFTGLAVGYGLLWTISQTVLRLRLFLIQKSVLKTANAMTRQLIAKGLNPKNQKLLACGHSIEMFHREASQYVEYLFWHTIPILLQIFISFGITLKYSGLKVALTLTAVLIAYLVTFVFSFRRIRSYQNQAGIQYADFSRKLMDGFAHLHLLHFFNGQKGYQRCVDRALQEVEASKMSAQAKTETMASLQALVLGSGLTALFFLMGKQIAHKLGMTSDLILVHGYFLQLSLPLMCVGFMILSMQQATAVFRSFIPLFLAPEIDKGLEVLRPIDHDEQSDCIRLRKVGFHVDQKEILQALDLNIRNNEFIVLTGPSGQGKTTLIRLLTKQLSPTSGTIELWDQPIDCYSYTELFEAISIASQEIEVFNQSVYENLCCFREKRDISLKAIEEVLRATLLYDHVQALPDGLHTVIDNHSPLFSRGQLQRLTLARALLKPASLYIFDEPTAALDMKTALEVLNGILTHLKNRTVLMVTHRLEIMRRADKLVVLKEGAPLEVLEAPSHLGEVELHDLLSP